MYPLCKSALLIFVIVYAGIHNVEAVCDPLCVAPNGECVDPTCYCLANYGGVNCQDECATTCSSTPGEVCTGTTGGCVACTDCDSGHGVCTSTGIAAVCRCNDGYTGDDCKTCSSDVGCNDDGTCATGTCTCNEGFAGTYCQLECTNVCGANGDCEEVGGAPECVCDDGWVGDACTLECSTITCVNGECVDDGGLACDCTVGWSGDTCETISCGADGEPCVNGECTNGTDSNPDTCTCTEGWQGTVCDQSGAAGLLLSSALMLLITAAYIFK